MWSYVVKFEFSRPKSSSDALKANYHINTWRLDQKWGAGCSSVDSVPAFEAVGRRIDPSQWTQLQFGLFSVPTSGPQLVYHKGCGMYCSVYGKVHIKDPLLLIEKSSLCCASGFPSKKSVNMTIWMTSNNRW